MPSLDALPLLTGAAPGPGVFLDARMPAGLATAPGPPGGLVASWADISGNSRDATQPVSTNQPVTSPGGMTWQAGNHMTVPYPGVVMRQFYVVARASLVPAQGVYLGLLGGTVPGQLNLRLDGPSSSPVLRLNVDNQVAIGAANWNPGTTDLHVYSCSYANPGAWVIRADGSQLAAGTASAPIGANLPLRVGNDSSGANGWQGTIAAVLAYPDVHDAATSYRVEKYLAGAYGARFPGS